MRRISCLITLIVLCAAASADPRVRETHKDWTVICDTPEQIETEVCLIVQQRNLRDSDQPVIRVEIGYAVQTGAPFAVVTAPLGVALGAGLSMQIDQGKVTRFEYGSCIPKGCIVGTGLSDADVATMKKGTEMHFTFKDNRNRDIAVPVSLSGFTAAMRAIQR